MVEFSSYINNKSERNYRGKCLGWPVTSYGAGKRWFPLVFSRCGVQGKLKLLLGFGFIVSFNIVLLCTYTLKFFLC